MRRILPIGAALACLALAAPAAQANFVVAIGDQNAGMFAQPRFQALKIKKVRYIVPWDFYKDAGQAAEVAAYMNAARAAKQDVLVAFTARRGCYNGRYSRSKACRAPSASAYKSAFLRFDRQYNWVKTYSAWNEVNHVSQPTAKSPKLAARYYNVAAPLHAARATSGSSPRTCSTRATCRATCARSCAPPRAARACGACTTTPTSTASARAARRAVLQHRARRGVDDRDRRHPAVRAGLPALGVARGQSGELHVLAGRHVLPAPPRLPLADHAALLLPVHGRRPLGALRRRAS